MAGEMQDFLFILTLPAWAVSHAICMVEDGTPGRYPMKKHTDNVSVTTAIIYQHKTYSLLSNNLISLHGEMIV
jgi:hypothetical protein